jgi:SIR2-like domain
VTDYLADIEDLISAIRDTPKPLAILVGSALSIDPADPEHGVLNVAGMLELVRETIEHRGLNLSKFETSVRDKQGSEAYQIAMSFLQANSGQDEVNKVIQQAVLRARRDTASDGDRLTDGKPSDWYFPRAIDSLAEWLVAQKTNRLGAVLTTNFDPLIELAIEAHGGNYRRIVMDTDGRIDRDVELQEGVLRVVHLHGYWRGSDTLHTPNQLTVQRPHLSASLQRLLGRHMVIVVGYGGWDDAFTVSLENVLQDDEADVDVRWAFHETDATVISTRYRRLFEKVQPALLRGRFVQYAGVDCHQLFELLVPEASVSDTFEEAHRSSIDAWVLVDPTYLGAAKIPLNTSELRTYFDGQVPTWRHALSERIPRRAVVEETVGRILDKTRSGGSNSLSVLLGASGEGKSTALLQVAADVARRADEWNVIWRPTADTVLDPRQVADMSAEPRPSLLVTDDADRIVEELFEVVTLLHSGGKRNVHILACARDTDWHHRGGGGKPWSLYVDYDGPSWMRGISAADALQVVVAWGDPAVDALGELQRLPDDASRARALEEAAREEGPGNEGSFFGGLLRARFSAAGLMAHVSEMINRLESRDIGESGRTLGDAFLYIAACHVAVGPLDRRVLADLMGVPYDRVGVILERPLGEEAASVRAGLAMWTRHPAVAEAAVEVAHRDIIASLSDLYGELVRQTIITQKRVEIWPQSYQALVHCGARLAHRLPKGIAGDARHQAAVAAVQASVQLLPDDLSVAIDYSMVLRRAGEPTLSLETLQAHWSSADHAVDRAQYIRPYCTEWGLVYRRVGDKAANVWMQLVSLSDFLNPAPLTVDDLTHSCVMLIGALQDLVNDQGSWSLTAADRLFVSAKSAAEWIKREITVNWSQEDGSAGTSGSMLGGGALDLDEALYKLFEGGQSAVGLVKHSLIPFVPECSKLNFQLLRTYIDSRR